MSNDLIVFRALFTEGIIFKKLVELFKQSFTKLVLTINKEGIFSRISNAQDAMLFDLSLTRDNFSEFHLESDQDLFFGINTTHTYKIISSMKKKDLLKLEIRKNDPTRLYILIYPKGKEYLDSGFVVMENIQILEIDLPVGYNSFPIRGSSTKFSKMCKELHLVSKNDIIVRASATSIAFEAMIEGILYKETVYGNFISEEIEVEEVFRTDDFLILTKLSSIGSTIFFSIKQNLPFCVSVDIGFNGKLSIYIRNKQQILETLDTN